MTATVETTHLLDDEAVARFVTYGYHIVPLPDLEAVHRAKTGMLQAWTQTTGETSGNWDAEKFSEIWEHPAVIGALTSLLGNDYRGPGKLAHCHGNKPGKESVWTHRDSYSDIVEPHRTQRCTCFYYPHRVTAEMGPTLVFPDSQYRQGNPNLIKHYMNIRGQAPLIVDGGTFVITSCNLWHGAAPNKSDVTRYLVKVNVGEAGPRTGPSWNHDPANLQRVNGILSSDQTMPMSWAEMVKLRRVRQKAWDYLMGRSA